MMQGGCLCGAVRYAIEGEPLNSGICHCETCRRGLLPLFEPHVFGADLVTQPKPAPDLFLCAAARMGAEPVCCVVVEDSVAGVRAAVAAGMRVLGFHGGGHCAPEHDRTLMEAGAAATFGSMAGLAELLRGAP